MQRSSVALGLILVVTGVLTGVVKAGDDDFKWDPKKKKTPAVGDRFFSTQEDNEKAKVKIGVPGQPPQTQDQDQTIKTRLIHEVLKVEDGKIVKEKVTVERFLLSKGEGTDDDKSLEGRTIVVSGKGDKRKVRILGDEETLSPEAKAWAEKALAKDKGDEDERIFPDKPIGADGEWDLEVKKLAEEMFPGVEIDAEGSSAKGKLTNVRVEDGVHMGHLDLKIKIKLKKLPGTPFEWKDGGILEMTMGGETSLEGDKSRKKTVKMDGKLKGKAEQESDGMTIALKMDMTMASSMDEGDMPKGTGEEPKEEAKKEPKKDEPKPDAPKPDEPKKMGE
jgi:hypothetical protein